MSDRNSKLSALTPTTRKKVLQLSRWVAGHPDFRKAGLSLEVFETGRTAERQRELYRAEKSWVKKSPHQNGTAADLVLCVKAFRPLRIPRFYWDNSKYYRMLSERADSIGLCSYGLSYGYDIFHFELPAIWQPESDCFAYSVVNALRWRSADWRRLDKQAAAARAEQLQQLSKTHSLKGTLTVAKSLKWIIDFEEVDTLEVNNEDCFVCQTRSRYIGKDRIKKQLKRIDDGKGLASHATAIAEKVGGLVMINSHAPGTYPGQYTITPENYGEVSKVFKIIL